MRRWPALLALPLLFAGCSCHREPEAGTLPPATPGIASDADEPAISDPSAAAESPSTLQDRPAPAFREAASTLHAYLAALLNPGPASDAFWVGGKPAPRPDDAVLRSLQGLHGLRVENDAPHALDREDPPHAIEVPVRLTASTPEGHRRFIGWYRLRARVDGRGWEITSASLQPVID